ncbi:hypothetical protein B0H19DRAFT_1134724 [Mycena capillaripes]|nr:hypothetical protein B0H19DRAFT_1134724 [Mycena capillaripes]
MFLWKLAKAALASAPVGPPRLPEDLERQIFEIAALENSRTPIPTLLRVARRTHIWLKPLLYRVWVLSAERNDIYGGVMFLIQERLCRKSISWDFVRHLFMRFKGGAVAVDLVLSKCTGVQDLVFDCGPSQPRQFLPHLGVMQLRRLGIHMEHMFGTLETMDLRDRVFASLTHLLILDFDKDASPGVPGTTVELWPPQLALLPRLTHIAFVGSVPAAILHSVLKECTALQVLVSLRKWMRYWVYPPQTTPVQTLHRQLRVEDVRFVFIPFKSLSESWEVGARGGEDVWVCADKFVAAKRRVEIAGSSRDGFVLRS